MKINNINNNRNINFSSLCINKISGAAYLSKCGKKNLEKIDSVGELLKNTKYYHLYIDSELSIKHVNGDRFYPPFLFRNAGNSLIIRHKYGTAKTSKRIVFENDTKTTQAYESIKSASTQIEKTGLIVKYLDEFETKKNNIQSEETIIDTDSAEKKIEKLITKYGV